MCCPTCVSPVTSLMFPYRCEYVGGWLQILPSEGGETVYHSGAIQRLDVAADKWDDVPWPTTTYGPERTFGVAAVV
jgi:hypothetical protein